MKSHIDYLTAYFALKLEAMKVCNLTIVLMAFTYIQAAHIYSKGGTKLYYNSCNCGNEKLFGEPSPYWNPYYPYRDRHKRHNKSNAHKSFDFFMGL